MTAYLQEKDRNIIPRWRDFRTTLSTGELDPVAKTYNSPKVRIEDLSLLEESIREWRENKTLTFAADLIAGAYVLGETNKVIDAAKFILESRSEVPLVTCELAYRIIHPDIGKPPQEPIVLRPEGEDFYKRVQVVRSRLRNEPRNPFLWVDLALYSTIAGKKERAERAMRIAIALAPENRFVLRSASRFYLHLDEFDYAHYILSSADSLISDPWLLSAEIAAASAAGRTSRYIKKSRRLLDNFSRAPLHIAELNSALATLEMVNGNNKGARKLFRQSLEKPTENSVAQAVWASKYVGPIDLERGLYTPRSYEARTLQAYRQGDWEHALHRSIGWLYDQPFSARPAQIGCYVAAVALGNYEQSLNIINLSLRANPDDPSLLFNKVFTLASNNQPDEAEQILNSISLSGLDPRYEIIRLANKGLIAYRKGSAGKGRIYYRQAIEKAIDPSNQKLRAMAIIYFAREELLSNSPRASAVVELANEEAASVLDSEVKAALGELDRIASSEE